MRNKVVMGSNRAMAESERRRERERWREREKFVAGYRQTTKNPPPQEKIENNDSSVGGR